VGFPVYRDAFEIAEGKLWLPQPKPWLLNITTGKVKYEATKAK